MPSRRTVLASTCIALSTAGCVGDPTQGDGGTPEETPTGDGGSRASDATLLELHHDEREETWALVTYGAVRNVGKVEQDQSGQYYVPMTLTEEGAATFASTFEEAGVYEDHEAFTIHTIVDGESVFEAGLAEGLVEDVESGDWQGRFLTFTGTEAEAERLHEQIRTGGE